MDSDPCISHYFPSVIYYPDGYRTEVQTAEELARMPPGYGRDPNGPFPGLDLATLSWDLQYAPFAPPAIAWPEWGGSYRGVADVFAPKDLIIDRHVYWKGMLIPRPVTLVQVPIEKGRKNWQCSG